MEFDREDLDFFLPDSFKGLSKDYLLECIFDYEIQNNWKPSIGDIIVGSTGNVFVISNIEKLNPSIGGDRFYFGGGSCNRDGGNILDSTYCYTANESGIYYDPLNGEEVNLHHTSIRKFRYVPYPHEKNVIKNKLLLNEIIDNQVKELSRIQINLLERVDIKNDDYNNISEMISNLKEYMINCDSYNNSGK